MALIGRAYPGPSARARAIGIWAMAGAVASSSAPVLGGVLTVASRRLIFLIDIPVGIAAVTLAARAAPHLVAMSRSTVSVSPPPHLWRSLHSCCP
jgi:MFS transporter, DHA2 family, methylenomycin A resistance protein